LLAQVLALDLDALVGELSKQVGEIDQIRINVRAAYAGGAAHGWIVDLDRFHGVSGEHGG
jgi:hypothetical protein